MNKATRFDELLLSSEQLQQTVQFVRDKLNIESPIAGIITGSGFDFAEDNIIAEVPYSKIPNCGVSSVAGHTGRLLKTKIAGREVLVADGRFHRYEGFSWDMITLPVRIFAETGCNYLINTAAVGSVCDEISAGDIVAITDHINLMGDNPLAGRSAILVGERFVDLSSLYSSRLIEIAEGVGDELGIPIKRGVYTAFPGANYETPAEIEMVRRMGGDVVGMSMVPESLVAAKYNLEVLAFAMVTNAAGQSTSHKEVVEIGGEIGRKLSQIIYSIIREL